MFTVTRMSGKLYAMETVDALHDLAVEDSETERLDTLILQGTPVVFCSELEDLSELILDGGDVEIIESML